MWKVDLAIAWNLELHMKVAKRQVDSFRPGRRIPSCQLRVDWTNSGKPVKALHRVELEGAKEPRNVLSIECDPLPQQQAGSSQGRLASVKGDLQRAVDISLADVPSLVHLMLFPARRGNINIPQQISSNYKQFFSRTTRVPWSMQ